MSRCGSDDLKADISPCPTGECKRGGGHPGRLQSRSYAAKDPASRPLSDDNIRHLIQAAPRKRNYRKIGCSTYNPIIQARQVMAVFHPPYGDLLDWAIIALLVAILALIFFKFREAHQRWQKEQQELSADRGKRTRDALNAGDELP